MADGVIGFAVLALWVYCIFDAVTSDRRHVRTMPKTAWVILIVLFSLAGSVGWLIFGRPRSAYEPAEVTPQPPRRRVMGPEDAPDFEERFKRGMRRDPPSQER